MRIPTYTCDPTCALVHLGTNDIFWAHSVESTLQDIYTDVNKLKAQFPGVVTLLAVPIPGDHHRIGADWRNNSITRLQEAVRALGDDATNRVFIVDVADGYDAIIDNQPDKIHPR